MRFRRRGTWAVLAAATLTLAPAALTGTATLKTVSRLPSSSTFTLTSPLPVTDVTSC
jgi:hypothetical protein